MRDYDYEENHMVIDSNFNVVDLEDDEDYDYDDDYEAYLESEDR